MRIGDLKLGGPNRKAGSSTNRNHLIAESRLCGVSYGPGTIILERGFRVSPTGHQQRRLEATMSKIGPGMT